MSKPASRLEGLGISLIRRVVEVVPPDAINLGFGEPTFETPECGCFRNQVLGANP